jgi:hypothetical protein
MVLVKVGAVEGLDALNDAVILISHLAFDAEQGGSDIELEQRCDGDVRQLGGNDLLGARHLDARSLEQLQQRLRREIDLLIGPADILGTLDPA